LAPLAPNVTEVPVALSVIWMVVNAAASMAALVVPKPATCPPVCPPSTAVKVELTV
jgi:hypothetical protein